MEEGKGVVTADGSRCPLLSLRASGRTAGSPGETEGDMGDTVNVGETGWYGGGAGSARFGGGPAGVARCGTSRRSSWDRAGRVGDSGCNNGDVPAAPPIRPESALLDPMVIVDAPPGPLLYELPLSRRK